MTKQMVICLSCEADYMLSAHQGLKHKRGCRDVGVLAENWEKRDDGEWYLKGTDKKYKRMELER